MTNLVRVKLRPCPYCGKTPIIRHKGDYSINPYFVQCKNEDCQKKPEGWHCDTLKEAVDCWNDEMSGELND